VQQNHFLSDKGFFQKIPTRSASLLISISGQKKCFVSAVGLKQATIQEYMPESGNIDRNKNGGSEI
jgi:hypothetical protein